MRGSALPNMPSHPIEGRRNRHGATPPKSLSVVARPSQPGRSELTVELGGYLDAQTVPNFDAFLKERVGERDGKIILLLDNLVYVSSAGIGLLMEWANRIRSRGGEMLLVHPTDRVFKTLDMLGFTRVLRIARSEEEVFS